jgi:phospholipid/cholesterol/gamma-HCH transport system ATP-binding protein
MICVEDLWKSFGAQEVLRGVSLRVRPGEFMALVGLSGCGKSVLLKHVVRLLEPDRGRVLVDGEDLAALSRRELEATRSRMGYLFQNSALFDSLTVYENVAFPLREKTRLGEGEIRRKVMSELKVVGLENAEEKYPAQLSGGMVKRVALARTLVRDPEIVLLDEPTTGLDPIVSRAILRLFASVHRRRNLTGILVSHDVPAIFGIVEKVAMLHGGKIVAVEPSTEARASRNPMLAQFVNGDAEGPIQHIETREEPAGPALPLELELEDAVQKPGVK